MSEAPGLGSRIGQYRLVRELGRGGMGVVYEVLHEEIGRRAAIKVLSPRCADDPHYVRRFLTEARAISRVHHPGLVQLYDFGQTAAGVPYLLMELLAGETLRSRLGRRARGGERLPIAEVRRAVRQIAGALAATHGEGIVHRDLKPENVMLVADEEAPGGERVKLLDFGIARFFASEDATLTAPGSVLGTAAYMSPEQCASDAEVGAAADAYALGAMLHELLAGAPPFDGPTSAEVMRRHLVEDPPPPPATAPPDLAELVARLLAKEPTRRPSMRDVIEALAAPHDADAEPARPRAQDVDLTEERGTERGILRCPYPGMRPYATTDAGRFHGRDAEIAELLGRLRMGERELYVIGPSGSGKSSLVAAGVLPRLARGAAGLGPFGVLSMRPGEQPASRLGEVLAAPDGDLAAVAGGAVEALLARDEPGASLLIVIDQLEELFTVAGADERDRFLAALRALRGEPHCAMVLLLRADFFGAFMESPLWTERRGRISRVEVGPLCGEPLREAIVQPARDLGVLVEPALVERLLADAASEPGILPLLQETMIELWERRRDRTLALADYQALGDGDRSGLAVALARRADAILRALTPAQEAIARRILLRLISFGEGRADTRRQQSRSKLRAAGDDAAAFEHVLQTLIADRLLATDDDDRGGEARVDLAHEVMITAWPTLVGWTQAYRADEQRRRQLEATAASWAERGRGTGGLLDPIELAEVEAWRRTEPARALGHGEEVAELVTASRAAQHKQRSRRRSLAGGALVTVAIFAVVVATLEVRARRRTSEVEAHRRQAEASAHEHRRLLAQSYQEAGRQLLLDGRPEEALPYLVAARQHGEGGAPLRMLFGAASRALPVLPLLEHQDAVWSAAFSPDGARVVTASDDQSARIWDAATGKPVASLIGHRGAVRSAAFSADGTRIVTASHDGTARLWEATTGQPVAAPLVHEGIVWSAAFSLDGTRVGTASADGTTRVWDAATGKPIGAPLRHPEAVWSIAFDAGGRRVVTASEGTARVWDATTGALRAPPLEHQLRVLGVAFSPDGTRVVTASADKVARIWDAATGKPLGAPLKHREWVWSAAFSPDGTRVVTASSDRTARIWDAITGKPLTSSLEHPGDVSSAAFSPDGARVVTTSADGAARVWDAATGELAATFRHDGAVRSAAFSRDGARIVTASTDGTARVWDMPDAPRSTRLEHPGTVTCLAFSPDHIRVVTGGDDNTARIWAVATGKLLAGPLRHGDDVWSAMFSPDGARIVTGSEDKTAQIWDAATGNHLAGPLQHQGAVRITAFSPDGTRVVTASVDATVGVWDTTIWDATRGEPRAPPFKDWRLISASPFSPDSTRIVTRHDKRARIWSVATGKPLGALLQHQGKVWSASFSPDSTRVVTASDDKTARISDAVTGNPLTKPLEHQGSVSSALFSADGTRVVTASDDKTARIWDAATGHPLTAMLQHPGGVWGAEFSRDGARILTVSWDRTVRIWDATTGKPLALPFKHPAAVWYAEITRDEKRVVTMGEDKTVRVWEIRLDERTLAEWVAVGERGPFELSGRVHVRRAPRGTGKRGPDPIAR